MVIHFVTAPPVSLTNEHFPAPGLLHGHGTIAPEGDGFRVTAQRRKALYRHAGKLGVAAALLSFVGSLVVFAKATKLLDGAMPGVWIALGIGAFVAIVFPIVLRRNLASLPVDILVPRGQFIVRTVGNNYLPIRHGSQRFKPIPLTVDGYAPELWIYVVEINAELRGVFYCRALDDDAAKLLQSLAPR